MLNRLQLLVMLGLTILASSCGGFFGKRITIASSANEPTLAYQSTVAMEVGVKPERFDFVVFKDTIVTPQSRTPINAIYRLCGLPGDLIEMRDGILFINGTSTASLFQVAHPYEVTPAMIQEILPSLSGQIRKNAEEYPGIIDLPDSVVKNHHLPIKPMVLSKEETNEDIMKRFGQPWNIDHFGPFRVPSGTVFLLGDNRSSANDSRYHGPVSQADIVGVVSFKN